MRADDYVPTLPIRPALGLLLTVALLAGCGESPPVAVNPATNATAAMEGEIASNAAAPAEPSSSGAASEAAAADDITIEVVDVAGYKQALEKHRGKVVFVDFWATWCIECMEHFPHTVHLSRAFPNDQVAVISVSFDDLESKDAALEFLRKHEARFDNLLSEYGAGVESIEKFEIEDGIPYYKIYDREGQLAKTLAPGPGLKITFELLESEVRKVLEQK
jgi:thiol-disulfide isomerase/thioredoxin